VRPAAILGVEVAVGVARDVRVVARRDRQLVEGDRPARIGRVVDDLLLIRLVAREPVGLGRAGSAAHLSHDELDEGALDLAAEDDDLLVGSDVLERHARRLGPWIRIHASGWIERIFLIHSMSVGFARTTAWRT